MLEAMKEREILGLTEKIVVFGKESKKAEVRARIDTGATKSSIDVNIAKKLGLELIKKTRVVKSASGRGRREIALVKIKLDGKMIEEEFTLAERGHMTYPVLIGQNILRKGDFLIDPNKG